MALAPAPIDRVWAADEQQAMSIGPLVDKGVQDAVDVNVFVDCNAGPNQALTLGVTGTVLTLFNQAPGSVIYLRVRQGAAGSLTIATWTDIFFAAGTEPTVTAGANLYDWFKFTWMADLGKWYGEILGQDFKA